jgi:hypothetical protein
MEWTGWMVRRGALLLLLAAFALPVANNAAGEGTSALPCGKAATEALTRRDGAAEKKLGIEVVALRLSEGGNVLDLRYRVVDPAKAHACLSSHARPYLQDVASGTKLGVPDMAYVGALRQTAVEPLAGKVYFMLFWNPRRAVQVGQKIDLVVGDQTVTGLIVS